MKKEELKSLIDLKLTAKQIAEKLNVSKSCVYQNCRKYNLHIPNYQNMKHFNESVFDSIDNEEKAYWLGFLYADGYISKTNQIEISLKAEDYNHIVKFCKFISLDINKIKSKRVKYKNNYYDNFRVFVRSVHMSIQLSKLGCVNNKSLILKFPNENIFSSKELILHFIRGYIDGDGCITYTRNGKLELSILGTYDFLNDLKKHFNEFESCKVRLVKKLNNGVTSVLRCNCSKADKILTKLYKDSSIYLDRKYNRFAVLLSD